MVAEWFYRSGNSEHGPVSPMQLAGLAASGELNPGDQVRKGHDGPWVTAAMVRGLTFLEQGNLGDGGSGNVQVEAKVNDVGQPVTSHGTTPNQFLHFNLIKLDDEDHIAKITRARNAFIVMLTLLLSVSVVFMGFALRSGFNYKSADAEGWRSMASWSFSGFFFCALLSGLLNGLRSCVILLTDIRNNIGR